ncbi:hypothetical protein I4F81_010885 [Pyropia yezoensis]|uniref:Uncharacterized protein n=1 Tax=Pyropia yezoensis TaxID=2788 RepID=A0ACC3CDR0_PYRYE|nr:hypothetical protein I4F81_010885 [Neopyropia yezoensis]
MGLLVTVVRQAAENGSLSPGSKALIAVGGVLVVVLFLSILRTIIVRRGAWPWQPRPTPTPLQGPGGRPLTAAAADNPSSPHPVWAIRRCLGLPPTAAAAAAAAAASANGGMAVSPPPAAQPPPELKAVRDAIVGGTEPACPVEASRRTCAVCLNRLSMDGGERPAAGAASPWVCTLRCGHDFHAACVTRWAAREGAAASCPVCRKGVVGGGGGGRAMERRRGMLW